LCRSGVESARPSSGPLITSQQPPRSDSKQRWLRPLLPYVCLVLAPYMCLLACSFSDTSHLPPPSVAGRSGIGSPPAAAMAWLGRNIPPMLNNIYFSPLRRLTLLSLALPEGVRNWSGRHQVEKWSPVFVCVRILSARQLRLKPTSSKKRRSARNWSDPAVLTELQKQFDWLLCGEATKTSLKQFSFNRVAPWWGGDYSTCRTRYGP